jgi:ABC-type transporter Mla MlaB component
MLRVTTENEGELLLRLEGKLAGPHVEVVRECWERQLALAGGRAVRVDLRGLTCVDAAGKACLADMSTRGAQFIARDCLTKAMVAEISERTRCTDQQSE